MEPGSERLGPIWEWGATAEGASPGTWTPPFARLPAPHDHLALLSPLGSSGNRCAWAATSEHHPGCLVVILFLAQSPGDTIDGGDSGKRRYVIDLPPQRGWLPWAVVTVLPAPLPEPFDGFKLLSFVGLGPSGSVWMAESLSHPDIPLAIKFLDGYPELYRRDVRERFLEEAVASKRINSSFLLPTLDALDMHEHCAQGWAPVALMSWLQEPSLQRVLDDLKAGSQFLPEEMASGLIRDVLQGLLELHGAYELVHLDVKPSNVLLRLPRERPYRGPESLKGARAMLADFTTTCRAGLRPVLSSVRVEGVKPALSSETDTGDYLGTPAAIDEDWQGFLGIIDAVAKVADQRFRWKAEVPCRTGCGAKEIVEDLCARLFPEELRKPTVFPPDQVPSEERGIWRPMPSTSDGLSWPELAPVRPASEPLIEVSGYRVVQELGRGGMGVVYQAIDLRLHQVFAIKVLPTAYYSPLAVERLHIEAKAIAKLDHLNIVRVYEVGVLRDGRPYIAMEYLPGGSLKDWLSKPRTLNERAGLVRKLAQAVAFAHDRGVIHRDLKPANILLADNDTPKIIDFGLAKLIDPGRSMGMRAPMDPITASGQIMGTPGYMAPEQACGDGSVIGPRVDIYGLGGILYWLLTGKAPFEGHDQFSVLHRVRSEDPVPPRAMRPEIPRDLETICLKCLEKDPSRRYRSAAELADDLGLWLDGLPIRGRRVDWTERFWLFVKRNRRLALAWSIVLMLLLGLAGGAFFKLEKETVEALKEKEMVEALKEKVGTETLINAESAFDRGQYAKALSLFDDALKVAPVGPRPDIEVKRVRCLFTYGHWAELQKELDRLARCELPDNLRAQVLLFRGDLGLCDSTPNRQQAGRDLIRRALEVPRGLDAADAAYARGLLDESTFDAVRHLEEALAHAPFHLRANAVLLLELVLSGQIEKAERRAEWMRSAFPAEPVTPVALALIAALRGNGEARARHLAELRGVVADPQRIMYLDAALDHAINANYRMPGPRFLDFTAFIQLHVNLNAFLHRLTSRDEVGLCLPVLSRPTRMIEEMTRAYSMLIIRNPARASALLDDAQKMYPESLLRLFNAAAHMEVAFIKARSGDRAGCFGELRRAHSLAEEAIDAPTLLPLGPSRHNGRWVCVVIEATWTAWYRSDSASLAIAPLAFGAENPLGAVALVAAGQARPQTSPPRIDRHHLLHVIAEGGEFDAVRSDLLPRILPYFDDDDARLLLKEWAHAAPKDPLPFRLLASFELARKNFGEALRWAERGLYRHPTDPELRATRDGAKKSLKWAELKGK